MTDEPARPAPIVSLLWHGHRVEVFGDHDLVRRSGTRHVDPIGVIALAIDSAPSFDDMETALRQSTLGATHEVDVGVRDGRIEIRLRAR